MDTRRSLRRERDEALAALRVMTADRNTHRSLAATHLSGLTRVSEMYSQAHDDATRYRDAWQSARIRAGVGQLVADVREDDTTWLRDRLDRALRACARYRADAATQAAVTNRLTEQLFDSLGYDDVLRARLSPDPAALMVGEVPR